MVLISVLQHHLVFGRSVFFLLLIRVQADTQYFGVFSHIALCYLLTSYCYIKPILLKRGRYVQQAWSCFM